MQMQPLESHFNQSTINNACAEASPSTAQQSNSSSYSHTFNYCQPTVVTYANQLDNKMLLFYFFLLLSTVVLNYSLICLEVL